MNSEDKLEEVRLQVDEVNEDILNLLQKRKILVNDIAKIKSDNGLSAHQPSRFNYMLNKILVSAREKGIDETLVREVFEAIHKSSIKQQEEGLS